MGRFFRFGVIQCYRKYWGAGDAEVILRAGFLGSGGRVTEKQSVYVQGVLSGLGPAEAARAAGYLGHDAARALQKNPQVSAAIALARKGQRPSRENILSELGRIAMSREEKTGDKLRALDMLCRLMGLQDGCGAEIPEPVVIVEDI